MALFRRILSLGRRARMEREIDAELREHMAMCIDDNMAQGMSREAAERDARRRFGSPTVDARARLGGRCRARAREPLARCAERSARLRQEPGLFVRRGRHACAGHRRQHGYLRASRRGVAAVAAGEESAGVGAGAHRRYGQGARELLPAAILW